MKNKKETNYLDKIPVRPSEIPWKSDDNGTVTLEIENKGIMNKIAQALLKKPEVSFIHLDKLGSFVWQRIDGKKSIADIAPEVDDLFGEEAHPLYERLAQFFNILDSYKFIQWKNEEGH